MMSGLSIANRIDRAKLARVADGLAVAVAVSLPWSTSATSILLGLWLLALIPTLDWADIRGELATPAGGLPLLLFLVGALGMLWADVTLYERLAGLESFLKLLVIPLLFEQFRRSDHGPFVLGGYFGSCLALLTVSAAVAVWPELTGAAPGTLRYGIPVKNAATQSGEFVTCIFGILYFCIDCFERRRWLWCVGLLAVSFAMLFNIVYISTGRTALAIMPVFLFLLAARKLSVKGAAIMFAGALIVASIAWFSSSYLRDRTIAVWIEIQRYEAADEKNSSGERIEFWKKSTEFLREAPIIGHGTGSIHSLFIKSAIGQIGAAGSATTNPHNQTFAVAIQTGLIGAAVLWAMWIAHLLLFRGHSLVEWIGLVVVVQNIVGSLFNSHLFDFAQGWVYVLGVGVAGGMALKIRALEKSASTAT